MLQKPDQEKFAFRIVGFIWAHLPSMQNETVLCSYASSLQNETVLLCKICDKKMLYAEFAKKCASTHVCKMKLCFTPSVRNETVRLRQIGEMHLCANVHKMKLYEWTLLPNT
jgi:hypothetical protein